MANKGLPGFGLFMKGMMKTFGRPVFRRERHIKAQMKFWSGPKGRDKMNNNFWSKANDLSRRNRGKGIGLFGGIS